MITSTWSTSTDQWLTICLQQPASIHVFLCNLQAHYPSLSFLKSLLNTEEQQRAHRFIDHPQSNTVIHAAERFIITRGLLKHHLSQFLNKPCHDIHFSYGAMGKPTLVQTQQSICCHFNVSHSETYALLAISPICPVGVDIEYQKERSDYTRLAARVFHPAEQQWLDPLPIQQQHHAFYQIWTRKEALSKVTGAGLSEAFSSIALPQAVCISDPIQIDYAQQGPLWLCDLPPVQDYAAALAWDNTNSTTQVYCWQIDEPAS